MLEINKEYLEVKLNFLHPTYPFRYPSIPHIHWVPTTDILTTRTTTGRMYITKQKEEKLASEKLKREIVV